MEILSNTTEIISIASHFIGNRINGGELTLTESTQLHNLKNDLLVRFFLSPFEKESTLYHFLHNVDIKYHEIFGLTSGIFDDWKTFHAQANLIAQCLYEKGSHPQIKEGDFYIIHFKNVLFRTQLVNAIGLFKAENKEVFLKTEFADHTSTVEGFWGTNTRKLDKGCLIFNVEKEKGYIITVVDNTNKGEDTQYWVNDFLHISPRKDEYYNTHNVLSLCKNFVTKELPQQFDIKKADQADLLNRSVQFFKEKDSFDMEEFTNEVFAQPEVINSFSKYKENYEQDRNLEIADSFTISDSAVKKQARAFKSVIKLDKNFHIYVHGNRNLIEQGEDAKGKFYKVYYQEES